ncbi:DUF2194 domain-containing protein [Paenibacillus sp. CC-CFT747]|nr:DUF2194 domain-containing protein [Paenibacillus sp. CC-CFT747]
MVGTRFYAPEWDRMLGIADNRGFREGAMHGIRFDKPLFPGYLDLPSNNVVFSNSVLDLQLAPESVPYLSSEGTPLLWTHVYGQGKVVFWNWTSSTQKLGRGLLVQSIGLASESFVSAQVASRSLNIDDFPSPVPDSDNPLVRQEYGLSTQDFYERVWWEDMTRFAKVYGWKYTGLLIGNYQNQTDSPLHALTDDYAETIPYFGTKLIGMGGELGLHGYNHQSLVTRGEPVDPDLGYRPWQSEPAMEEGLVHLNDLAKKLFPGHELKTYVPPPMS